MDALWRGLKGAMVGAGIAGIIAVAGPISWTGLLDIPLRRFLALAALAGFFVGGIAGFAACLPRKGKEMLKSIAIVAGCAMLASPFVLAALRNWGMEPPDLSYIPPILAGLLGGVIALVYEAGVKVRSKADVDSENHTRVTIHDNRLVTIDRLWLWVSLVAWLPAAGLFLWPWWHELGGRLDEFFGMVFVCLLWGGILMLYFVGIPLCIALNLIFKERRRQRLWETVTCVIAFLSLSLAYYLMAHIYPPESMGY
jgi:NADH:ubiquinone oxidoreductase subunit 6 (subunit J)